MTNEIPSYGYAFRRDFCTNEILYNSSTLCGLHWQSNFKDNNVISGPKEPTYTKKKKLYRMNIYKEQH